MTGNLVFIFLRMPAIGDILRDSLVILKSRLLKLKTFQPPWYLRGRMPKFLRMIRSLVSNDFSMFYKMMEYLPNWYLFSYRDPTRESNLSEEECQNFPTPFLRSCIPLIRMYLPVPIHFISVLIEQRKAIKVGAKTKQQSYTRYWTQHFLNW